MEELVLHIDWGGLGDHLFWSHIPKAAKASVVKRVYVTHTTGFRNEDYRMIWTLNPYIDGFTDKPASPRVGDFSVRPGENFLDRHMLMMGVDDGNRFHEPEIYYQPQKRPEYEGLRVFDPNYVSGVGAISPDRIKRYLADLHITLDAETVVREKNYSVGIPRTVQTPTLTDYCDMIHSVKEFYCVTSGGATLAAALGRPATVFFGQNQSNVYRHSRLHRYVLV